MLLAVATAMVILCEDATGHHKLTAVAIARELGPSDEGAIALSDAELEKLTDDALQR